MEAPTWLTGETEEDDDGNPIAQEEGEEGIVIPPEVDANTFEPFRELYNSVKQALEAHQERLKNIDDVRTWGEKCKGEKRKKKEK